MNPPVLIPVVCRHLRAKQMYIESDPAEALREKVGEESSPSYYWCGLTQTPVGPDDSPVGIAVCKHARGCCES